MSKAPSSGPSRPSLTNSVTSESGGSEASGGGDDEGLTERQEKLADAVRRVRRSDIGSRAMSVEPERRLREEATTEKEGGGRRARSVAGAAKPFLRWRIEQEGSSLVFQGPEGKTATGSLPTSWSEDYADRQYGKLKDLERAFTDLARNPVTAMLTFTQSSENANGDPRCPADHLRELQDAWTDSVYHSLRNTLQSRGFERLEVPDGVGFKDLDPAHLPGKWWEFAVVLEPHKSGYLHLHVAVFLDVGTGEIEAGDFEKVLQTHVKRLPGASSEAHTVGKGASVNELEPGADVDYSDESAPISNAGSYISEYIAGYGDPIEERSAEEIAAATAIWATGTQRVRFSKGANKLAEIGLRRRGGEVNIDNPEWSVKEIVRPNGERHPPETGGGPTFYQIDGAPSADPVKTFPPPG